MDMYILSEGTLRIFKNTRTITTIRAVDYIGEMAIIEAKPRSASVEALSPCSLLMITAEQFNDYFSKQPKSLVALMKTLSQRIRLDTEVIADEFEKANILVHDMRNLLCSFLYLDLLKDDIEDERDRNCVMHMINASKNLGVMMEEALANAKRLHRPYTMAIHSLGELLLDVAESEFVLHPDTRDKHLVITNEDRLPPFLFNRLDIRRVVCNLVLNAAQASRPGDIIEVKALNKKDWVEIQVIDHGQGIPDEIKEKIFQPHFTTKPRGTGLGLASCKAIVEKRHGGKITFTSTPGVGPAFIVRLPLAGKIAKRSTS